MKTQPKVSVIVPIYKVEKYLVQCLDSIVNQTLKDIEIILVDEGDMDACRYIIDHYEQTDPRVIAIHEKNGGYGASVNKGFDIAKGEYISIIESDDFIDYRMFEEMYNYAKKLDADVVKTPYYEYWDKTENKSEVIKLYPKYEIYMSKFPANRLVSISDYPEILATHPSIWSCLYRRKYLLKNNIRCVEEKGAGYVDNPFRIETIMSTKKFAYLNKPFYYYRLSNPDASVKHFNFKNMISRWNQIHELFDTKFKSYKSVCFKYLLMEEYHCIFKYIYKLGLDIRLSENKKLSKHILNISKAEIKNSVLSEDEKSFLLKLQKDLRKASVIKADSVIQNKISDKTLSVSNIKVYLFDKILIAKITGKNKRTFRLFYFIPLFSILSKVKATYVRLFGLIPFIKVK